MRQLETPALMVTCGYRFSAVVCGDNDRYNPQMPLSGAVTETRKCAGPFVFIVPLAPIRRFVGLVAACLSLVPLTIFSWLLITKGARTELDGMLILSVCGILVLVSGFFLWVSFPHFKSAARLEFRRNAIRFIPAPIDRLLYGPVDAQIPSNAKRILLRYGRGSYKMLIQTETGGEYETGIVLLTELSAPNANELTNGISVATGLPAGIVTSRRLADGNVEDLLWKPRSTTVKWAVVGKLILGAIPIPAGAIVGFLTPSIVKIAEIGLILWLAQTLALAAYAYLWARQPKFPWLYWLSTIFTFGAVYTAIAVFASFEHQPH
jgi:hypothetical protein